MNILCLCGYAVAQFRRSRRSQKVGLNTSIIRPASNRYIRIYLERLHGAPYEPLDPVLTPPLARERLRIPATTSY